jgi:argininosuccinate synthase
MNVKRQLAVTFADLVYAAKWFTPLREAIQAFMVSTQEYVTGTARMRLYKGGITRQGTTSPYSLYNESLASFTTGDLYDHHDADGFITLYGLTSKIRAMMMQEVHKLDDKD